MQLELIIEALRTRCPTLGVRVAGAAEFKNITEASALPLPCAFVVPLDDNPGPSRSANSVRQTLEDGFAVIVAVANTTDERGQKSANDIHTLRAEVWAALLGWRPTEDYEGIVYDGGNLLTHDRARLWYQFEFSAAMEIGPEDGWQQTELAGLPHFDLAHFNADFLDPSDPNRPLPDGRIEVEFSSPQTGVFP